MKRFLSWLAIAFLACPSTYALCIYKGEMNATTTITQEFRDSKWVVHAKLIAEDDHWSDEDESYKIYYLQVMDSYKGRPPFRIKLATEVNSGGFYLDHLGDEYLLFLDSVKNSRSSDIPTAARGALEVNYNCGQSKAWTEMNEDDLKALNELAGGHPRGYRHDFPTDESSLKQRKR